MCRLFAMTTGGPRVRADFWLLDAPGSLAEQSRRQADGTGLGWFGLGGEPVRDRAPIPAYQDADFAMEARSVVSDTFLAHIRYASVGALSTHNTHPFDINDRLFAHNGVVQGLETISSWLSETDRSYMEGETDSETVFAYISAEIRRLGDTTAGVIEAVTRLARHVPIFALNFILAESGRLWALRYPATHPLWILEPAARGVSVPRQLHAREQASEVRLETPVPAVVVASERMNDDPAWRLIQPGELVLVDGVETTSLFPFPEPSHLLHPWDLSRRESASQAAHSRAATAR